MNPQKLSPQGYNINNDPMNENPFWEREGTGGNVPAGGLTGQVLTKRTDADYDTEWKTPESGGGGALPEGGNPGDIIVKTATGAEWQEPDFPSASDVADAVSAERTRAEAAEAQLSQTISTTSQELNDYKTTNNAAVADIRQDISDEISDREAADTALSGRIDNEAAARLQGDRDVDARVTAVASDLSQYEDATDAAISRLNTDLDTVEASVTSEANARIDADAILRQDLTQAIQYETTQRQSEDAAIRASIAEMSGLPSGGTTGQALVKASDTNFDVEWADVEGGGEELPPIVGPSATSTEYEKEPTNMTSEIVNPAANSNLSLMIVARWLASAAKFQYRWAQAAIFDLVYGTFLSSTRHVPALTSFSNGVIRAVPVTVLSIGRFANLSEGCLFAGKVTGASADSGNAAQTDPVSGGTTGQVLTKTSDADYDWEWATPSGGGAALPAGGSTGQALVKASATDGDVTWGTVPTTQQVSSLDTRVTALETIGKEYVFPTASGTAGQVLALQLTGGKQLTWATAATSTAVESLNTRMTAAETSIGALEQSATTAGSDIASLTTRMGNAEDDISGLQTTANELSSDITDIANGFVPVVLTRSGGALTGVCAIPWITVDPDGTVNGGTAAGDIPANWVNAYNSAGADRLFWRSWEPNGTLVLNPSSGSVYVSMRTYLDPNKEVTYTVPSTKGAVATVKRVSVRLHMANGTNTADGTVEFELHADGETVCKGGKFKFYDSTLDTTYEKANGMDDFIMSARWISSGNLIGINYGIMNDFFTWVYKLDTGINSYAWNIEPTVTMTFGLPNT